MYYACFVLLMLVPVAMIVMGVKWYVAPPAFQTGKLAYRTALTEKSPEVWFFAHTHCGKLWARYGVILSVITVLLMVFLDQRYQGFWLWLMGAQMLLLCVTIFMIDLLCKNLFDENGVRIDPQAKAEEPAAPEEPIALEESSQAEE